MKDPTIDYISIATKQALYVLKTKFSNGEITYHEFESIVIKLLGYHEAMEYIAQLEA